MRVSTLPLVLLLGLWAGRGSAQPVATERELLVVNHGRRTINEVYVSATSAADWGEDRLGDATLEPNGSARVRLGRVRDCEFDVQIVYDDASREEAHDVNVCATRQLAFDGSHAVLPPGADGGKHLVVVKDASALPIQQVMISPAAASDWGDDLLRHSSISVGASATVSYAGECMADLRVVFANRGAEERRGLDLCQLGGVSIQPGWTTADTLTPMPPDAAKPVAATSEDLTVTVDNKSGHDVRALLLTPEGDAERGPDLLGSALLADGDRISVTLSRPANVCRFNLHVVFGGKVADQDLTGFDLCHSPSVVLARRLSQGVRATAGPAFAAPPTATARPAAPRPARD